MKFFWPISLQNPTQVIFSFIKKIVSPLLLPLLLIFSSENGQFKCKSKNGRNLKIFWSISLQYPTQAIFSFIKKIVTPLLFAALGDLWEKRSDILIEYPHELSNPFAWYNYVHIYVNHACVGLSNSPLFSRSIQFGWVKVDLKIQVFQYKCSKGWCFLFYLVPLSKLYTVLLCILC